MNKSAFDNIMEGLEDALAFVKGDHSRARTTRGSYMVEGGIFTNTDFKDVEPGTQECYGPFVTYEEALEAWQGATWSKVDICCHRLVIKEL